jgi:diguanylate cyclase (GGDEF)-like protein
VLLVEDDPETLRVVRQALEAYKRVKFLVESVASTEALREKLARLAMRDELTGLYSRAFLVESLAREARRVRRHGRDLSCLMVDLDDFRLVNEAHGHQTGDAALTQVAALIRDSVRDEDLVARYGEDEFCVLLVETSLNEAMTIAERVRFELAAQPVVVDGRPFPITASIGVCAVNRRHDHQPNTVFDRAAAALRQAKAAGKNRVIAHLPPADGDEVEAGREAVPSDP